MKPLTFWNLWKRNKDFNIDSIIFEILKQKFLEKLSQDESEAEELADLLGEIEKLCDKKAYNNLCFLLHLGKPTDQPEFKNWSKMKGRLNCFTKARPYLSMLYDKKGEKYLCPPGRMQEIAKYALSYQFYISQLEDSETKPKYCSLLKDLVNEEKSKKFSSKHLKEFSLSFSKKNISTFKDELISEDSLEKGKYTGKGIHFDYPIYNQKDDDFVAHTIDLDERKENTDRVYYSDQKFRNKELKNYQKSDTVRGVMYKDDGKIDVQASIDFLSKNKGEESEKSPMSRGSVFRRDSDITHSMHRLASYRSIQHEPSNKKQYDYVSKSNYSALKSQKDRFTPSQCDSTSQVEGGDLTMKRFDSDAGQSSSSHVMRHNRSEYRAYSARDTDEMLYNIMTIREKGFINDTNPIRTGCFSPEGMHFTLGTNSKSIKICSINEILESFETEEETGDLTSNHANCQIPIAFDQLNYHDGSIYCINWSPNERLIATGSNDKQIKLLVNPLLQEGDTENILELTLAGHTAKIRSVWFHPNSEDTLFSGGNSDGEIFVWDTETGEKRQTFDGHEGGTFSISPLNSDDRLVSVGKDSQMKIWDLRNHKPLWSIDLKIFGEPDSVAIKPDFRNTDRTYVAVSHEWGKISYWDLDGRNWINESQIHDGAAKGLSFSFDGKYITSAGYDNKVQIMNTKLEVIKTLEHKDKALSAVWHPFLPLLLTTSADKSAKIWTPSTLE